MGNGVKMGGNMETNVGFVGFVGAVNSLQLQGQILAQAANFISSSLLASSALRFFFLLFFSTLCFTVNLSEKNQTRKGWKNSFPGQVSSSFCPFSRKGPTKKICLCLAQWTSETSESQSNQAADWFCSELLVARWMS